MLRASHSPIYLHKVEFALLLVYIQSLTTASENRLFGSVLRTLVLYQGDPGKIPSKGIFQLCFTLRRLSCKTLLKDTPQ